MVLGYVWATDHMLLLAKERASSRVGHRKLASVAARIAAARTLSEAQCFQGFLGMYLGHEVGVHPVAETTPVGSRR